MYRCIYERLCDKNIDISVLRVMFSKFQIIHKSTINIFATYYIVTIINKGFLFCITCLPIQQTLLYKTRGTKQSKITFVKRSCVVQQKSRTPKLEK